MEVHSIAPGLDFVRVLEEQVAKCDVLLAVIGRGWLDARNTAGKRRLDNLDDFVRVEIEAGLRLGKRVIPVLVNDVDMPRSEESTGTSEAVGKTQRRSSHPRPLQSRRPRIDQGPWRCL
jgi:hypothetical protein